PAHRRGWADEDELIVLDHVLVVRVESDDDDVAGAGEDGATLDEEAVGVEDREGVGHAVVVEVGDAETAGIVDLVDHTVVVLVEVVAVEIIEEGDAEGILLA